MNVHDAAKLYILKMAKTVSHGYFTTICFKEKGRKGVRENGGEGGKGGGRKGRQM